MSAKEIPVQRVVDIPVSCSMVETMLRSAMDLLKERLEFNEHRVETMEKGMDGHVSDLWATLRSGQESLADKIREQEKETGKSVLKLQEQILMRVPAWALAVMVGGGSIIGAMAAYILDHLK